MISSNREEFLTNLARKFGREFEPNPAPVSPIEGDHRATRLSDLSRPELLANYVNYCRSIGINVNICKEADLKTSLQAEIDRVGGGPVMFNNDKRLLDCGIVDQLNANDVKTFVWNKDLGRQNILDSNECNLGIVFAECGLTETGTIILESCADYGRSVSLLPKYSLVVLKASTVYPRMHQYAQLLDQRVRSGQRTPSLINLISGPSSTADIELVKVIGVHGPIEITYLIIDDDNSCVGLEKPQE